MRIIKQGRIPNLEYLFTCNTCGCEFAVTRYELINENSYIDKSSYKCPICGEQAYGPIMQEVEESESESDREE